MPKFTLKQLEERIKQAQNGCNTLYGEFFEEGSPHRWRCGDALAKDTLNDGRRKNPLIRKRLCPNCKIVMNNCHKKILKLKEPN